MIAKKAWDRIQLNEFYEYKLNSISTVLSGQIEEICQKYKYQDQFSLESEICDKIFIEKYVSEKLKKFAILKDFYPMEDDYKINIFSQNTAIIKFEYKEDKNINYFLLIDIKPGKKDIEFNCALCSKSKYNNLYINQKNYVLYYKKYNFFEYKQLGFVLDDINNLDFQQFNEKISLLKSNKYKINQKNAEIAKNSINTLCRSFLGLKKIKYSLMLKNIFAKIIYENKNSKNNELIIFYSDFFTDPKTLTDLLKNIEKPN